MDHLCHAIAFNFLLVSDLLPLILDSVRMVNIKWLLWIGKENFEKGARG